MTEPIENYNKENDNMNNNKNPIPFSNLNANLITYSFSQENIFNELLNSANFQESKNNSSYYNFTESTHSNQTNQENPNIVMNKDQLYQTFILFQKFLNQNLIHNKMNLNNINLNNISPNKNENQIKNKIYNNYNNQDNINEIVEISESNDKTNENINEEQSNGKKTLRINGEINNWKNDDVKENKYEENHNELIENKNIHNIINGKDFNNGGNDNVIFFDEKENKEKIKDEDDKNNNENIDNKENEITIKNKEKKLNQNNVDSKDILYKDEQGLVLDINNNNIPERNNSDNINNNPSKNPYDDIPIKFNKVNFIDLVEKKLADEKQYAIFDNEIDNKRKNEIPHKIKNKKEKENINKHQYNINYTKRIKNKIYVENKKTKNDEKQIELNYNEIFKDFNIINLTPKYKLSNHGENPIYTILQLQDGRLASGGEDGAINIYNKETFKPELTINEHSNSVYHIIQLKNGNLISCSNGEKTMNVYQLLENNNYKLLSQINVGKINQNYSPRKIRELENGQIGLVAQESIIFYLNINNQLDEDFKINKDDNQIGNYYNMIPVKPGELVICGNKDKIQFFELNSRKLKEIININRDIHWSPDNLLCMMNERCLCVGGTNKITLIDVYQKSIIKEIEDQGVHFCLCKLNDNILLSGKENDITQWKISQNNLTLVSKKEKAHQGYIFQIIKFNNLVISCSDDKSIKIW